MAYSDTILTPRGVRAARALLAWKQSDLARAASVATSTVADFERGQRTPVANNATAIREALEAQGIQFLPGGVVVSSKPLTPIAPKPGRPMRWIEAHDLKQWAGSRDGQAKLPELVTRLILAVYGPAATLRFPSDDSIQHAGWDGTCEAPSDSAYIPAGTSVWEVTTQRHDIGGKVKEEYDKRTTKPLGVNPSEACFIFLTPQRYPHGKVWAAERRAERVWRDVRFIDGDTLVNWLDLYPGVAEWLAIRINRRPKGLRNLGEVWGEWSLATTPELSQELVLADRDDQAVSVLRWLNGPESVLSVQAEAADEAIAFLHAVVGQLPINHRIYWESRILAAHSDEVAREFVGLGPKLIVVLNGGDPGVAAALVNDGHHVYAAYGSEIGSPSDVMRLEQPWRHTIGCELEAMSVPMLDARRFAGQCGRSLTVLRRILTEGPTSRPVWTQSSISSSLIAAMLAGAWCEDYSADRKILEKLSGRSYQELEAELAPLASSFDGPLRRSGPVWKLASLRDAWFVLGSHLTTHHLDLLEQCFLEVLGEPSPNFDTSPQDWWKLHMEPPKQPSNAIRRGLSETIVVLGVFPNRASSVSDATSRSGRAVRHLLSEANERLWWSLSGDFRNLAEAAPADFLECVDNALDKVPTPLAPLFRSDEGFLHPSEYLADLLWALELLCWSPMHLGAGALLLARLADVDPGGKLGNRPRASLQRIFLPWAPQTYATAEQRLQVLDAIIKRFDRIGWNLLLDLAPTNHGFSHVSAMPHWRDYSEHEPEPITRQGIAQADRAIGERLLAKAGQDPQRWSALLQHWANFDLEWRVTAAERLAKAVVHFPDSDRITFREKLRHLIDQHETFSDADWTMDAASLQPLKAIFDSLEPIEVTAKHAWLFKRGNYHFRGGATDPQAMLLADQRSAVEEIAAVTSLDALIDYARTLELPEDFGHAFAASSISDARKDELLDVALRAEDRPIQNLGQRMIFVLGGARDEHWVWGRFDRAIKEERPNREILPFALALPANQSTWNRIAASGLTIDAEYWRRLPNHFIPPEEDFHVVVEKFLSVGRGRAALSLIGDRPNMKIASADILRVLRDPATISFDGDAINPNDGVMVPYHVACAFKHLDADEMVSEEELVGLEWTYFNTLQHSDRPARTLHKALSAQPRFFVQLLSAVFHSNDEAPPADPAEFERARAIATQGFRVLEEWKRVPGSDDAGVIDGAALEAWVKEARRLCAEAGRAEIGDSRIGRVLSAAPRVPGEAWPPEPIREVIERCRSRDLEEGFRIGLYNRRGVTVRLPTDGGQQERELAAQYRADALACFAWPRTQALLERIAESYVREATREDQDAEQRDWT
jgi:transcriptional regulator with XRE-family HTH domain